MRLEGSFTSSRVKFCDSPMMRASSSARCSLALVAAGDDREGVNGLVFAVALVGVGIEITDECAFHNGFDCVRGLQSVFRSDEGEAAQAAGLERAHGSSGEAAQIGSGESLAVATAEQQQSLGLQLGGMVQHGDFKRFSGDFAAGY